MKNFPSALAVIGAWLCACGFILPGIVAFLASSLWSMYVHEDFSVFTLLFFAANVFAFFKIIL
jgi:hypothetical protein